MISNYYGEVSDGGRLPAAKNIKLNPPGLFARSEEYKNSIFTFRHRSFCEPCVVRPRIHEKGFWTPQASFAPGPWRGGRLRFRYPTSRAESFRPAALSLLAQPWGYLSPLAPLLGFFKKT
jgi:hypothetical protein